MWAKEPVVANFGIDAASESAGGSGYFGVVLVLY